MTRDEVIDECIAAVNRGCNYCDCLSEVEALKSKPPEKSLEVEAPREGDTVVRSLGAITVSGTTLDLTIANDVGAWWKSEAKRMDAERDALRLQVGELKLALQGAQAEVAQLRWERAGSPMPGETPTDG